MRISVIETADGSPTLHVDDINENYHSLHGALTESRHIYLNFGIVYRSEQLHVNPLRVFEVGFGTGLNATLAAMTDIPMEFVSIEKFPVEPEIISQLDFGTDIDKNLFRRVHEATWDKSIKISDTFILHKIKTDISDFSPSGLFDVILMDAFAPEKQPEMWTEDILRKLASMMSHNAVLTTYCAKGRIRRFFEAIGLKSERLPGPPGGKREILRITKL